MMSKTQPPQQMTPSRSKSAEFRRQREATWHELEALVMQVERSGLKALDAQALSRLPILYRSTLSALSVARAISLDRALLQYLESLSTRAYFCMYGTRKSARATLAAFFFGRWPALVFSMRYYVLVSTALVMLGVLVAAYMTVAEAEHFYTFVDRAYAQGRGPEATTEFLRSGLFDGGELSQGRLTEFSSMLMTHNSKIGMMCFVLGAAFGVPVIYLLFKNGLVLGSFVGLYASRGLGVELMSWLLPHGVTEVLAIILCGACGLYIAEAVVFPGELTRKENLVRKSRDAGAVVFGAVLMFMLAGLIEGIFRQSVQDMTQRFALAGATALFWLVYFGFYGRLKATSKERA